MGVWGAQERSRGPGRVLERFSMAGRPGTLCWESKGVQQRRRLMWTMEGERTPVRLRRPRKAIGSVEARGKRGDDVHLLSSIHIGGSSPRNPESCGGTEQRASWWGAAHSAPSRPLHNDRCLDGENLGGLEAATTWTLDLSPLQAPVPCWMAMPFQT